MDLKMESTTHTKIDKKKKYENIQQFVFSPHKPMIYADVQGIIYSLV